MVEIAFFMLYPSGCAYLSVEIYIWNRSQASGYDKNNKPISMKLFKSTFNKGGERLFVLQNS